MTQIKLRRDTAANFTSKNPVLGVGEPAYETDTKKLKIGDGTTAYTQLDYFTSGGGGSTDISAALPLKIVDGVISLEVDGQTIQIVDGKLHANLDELGNEVNTLAGDVAGVQADLLNKQDKLTAVTTDSAQTISGQKEFDKTILFLGNTDLLRAQQSAAYRNGAGLSMGANSTSTDGGVFAPQWIIYNTTGGVDRVETIITTDNQSKLNSSNFNTANKLVKLDSDGKLPVIDGSNLTNLPSSSAPTNMVTTDTTQTISGAKTFTARTTKFKDVKVDGQIDCKSLRVSDPSFYSTNVSTFIGGTGTGIQMYDGTGDYTQFGISTAAKSTYIQPFYNCENLYINNYNDNSATNGVAANVVISGPIKNKVNGTINDVLTSGNVTAYVTEEFVDGTEGYRIWSNRRCEQWGSFVSARSITFLKNYADTNYMLLAYVTLKTSGEAYNGVFGTNKQATGFAASGLAGTTGDAYIIETCGTVNWYTSGVLAP